MKAYPKTSQKFTKEQLIFIADVMITSALDALQSVDSSSYPIIRDLWGDGIKEKLGFDLSILYAQITNDGIGCQDVMTITNMEELIDNYKDEDINTTKIATKFVNALFKEYLEKS
jgi:hypothetical protein